MRRCLFVLCLMISFTGMLRAQDLERSVVPEEEESPPPPPPRFRVERDPKTDHPTRQYILLVVDVSGSMGEKKLERAVNMAFFVSTRGSDDYYVGVISFTDGHHRWEGRPDPEDEVPVGWAALPKYTEAVKDYLKGLEAKGDTDPDEALRVALEDPQQQLTVVLITDGEFNDDSEPAKVIRKLQEEREHRAILQVVAIGRDAFDAEKNPDFVEVAAEVDGGVYCVPAPSED